MIDKTVSDCATAVAGIADGAAVMIGGFGSAGSPDELIDALIDQGARDLTIISNNAGNGETGIAALIKEGRVRKIVCSFPRQPDSHHFDAAYRAGEIELELVPQGNLAARIQAAGAGLGAIFTPTGFGTLLAQGKETRHIRGRDYVLEYPIHADVALIKAHRGDRWGNLVYSKTARNFGPIMAMAAKATIAQVGSVVPLGSIDPEAVVTPGIFVQRLVAGPAGREGGARGMTGPTINRLSRDRLAARVARDIPEGAYVNLGIGLPTMVANYLPPDSDIFLQSENGLLGMGPAPEPGEEDWELINAGKQAVTLLSGGAYFHHADSFAMMRGGHIDICVLGAFQVSVKGDLANWHTGEDGAIPAVGGAMDLAIGAKQTFVMMELLTRSGESKLVEQCSYPVTAPGCVSRIYTDLAVIDLGTGGARVVEMADGLDIDQLRRLTGVVFEQ